jgi:ketosteroid isomerase-like protein
MTRQFFTTLIAVLLLSIGVSAQRTAAAKPDPAKPVRDAFERLIEGIKEVNIDKVMDSYEKSDRLLIFNNNGSATIGWDNVRSNLEASYPNITNVTLEITGLRVEMMGRTAAYVSCKWKQSQENEGKLESAAGRMTLVYKLVGKDWKVAHRHTSPDRPDLTRPVFPSERETP